MEWEIPIYEQGMLRGQLRAERQGLRTVFRADCPAWDAGIRKVWLRGDRGNLLLGTLVPEGDRLRLPPQRSRDFPATCRTDECSPQKARRWAPYAPSPARISHCRAGGP